MNCLETRELLGAYCDGELNVAQNLEVERHLEKCPTCLSIDAGQRALAEAIAFRVRRFTAPVALYQKIRA